MILLPQQSRPLKCFGYRKGLITILTILLSSCAIIIPSPPSTNKQAQAQAQALQQINCWQIKGKVGLQSATEQGSALLTWKQQSDHYTILLNDPLGMPLLLLAGRKGQVWATMRNGTTYSSTTLERLLAEHHLPGQLPLALLYFWIRGLRAPTVHNPPSLAATEINQAGWRVTYGRPTRVGEIDLPTVLKLQSIITDLNIKIIIYQWILC